MEGHAGRGVKCKRQREKNREKKNICEYETLSVHTVYHQYFWTFDAINRCHASLDINSLGSEQGMLLTGVLSGLD